MERPIGVSVRMWVLAVSAAPEWVIESSIALEPNPKSASWAVPTWFTTKVWTDNVRIRHSVADGQSVAKIVDKALVLLCSPARGNSSSAFVQALAKNIILGIHHWTLYIQRQSRMTAISYLDYNHDDHTIPMLTIPREVAIGDTQVLNTRCRATGNPPFAWSLYVLMAAGVSDYPDWPTPPQIPSF